MTEPAEDMVPKVVAEQWMAYAQHLEEQQKMLIKNIRFLMTFSHETYHQHQDVWNGRVLMSRCPSATCVQTFKVLTALGDPLTLKQVENEKTMESREPTASPASTRKESAQ